MKKKPKTKKNKPDMPEFDFKEFTPEEGKIYEDAVNTYREAIVAGKTLKQAYDGATIADKELEAVIQADFLKILIAERHFAQGQALDDVARALSVPLDLVKDVYRRMVQEVGITAASQFGSEFGDITSKTSD